MSKEVKYGDYLNLYYNEKDKENICNDFFRDTSVNFLDYIKYLLDTDFRDVENDLLSTFELKKLPKRTDDGLIEGMLATTPVDIERKIKDKNYYYCNAICALSTLKKIFTNDVYSVLSQSNIPDITLHNYCHIVKYNMIDISQLINEYNNQINNDWTYSATTRRTIHSMSLHQILRQTLYGQSSLHSFADVEINASISVIRQIIELRLRRAFGLIGFINSSGVICPLDMTKIFDALKKFDCDIEFPVNLPSLERIYKWSNWYIHSGQGGYSWYPYFIEKFLKNFSFGVMQGDSWNYNNAIKTKMETIEKIKNFIMIGKDGFELCTCAPECQIIK